MSGIDPTLEAKVIQLRQKILDEDYTPTDEEVKEAFSYFKARRGAAAVNKAAKSTAAAPIDLGSLFGGGK